MSDKPKVWDRSASYSKIYYKYNKGIFLKWYFCPYCRKKFMVKGKDLIEIDHIIACNAVKKYWKYRVFFILRGKNVNDVSNLVAACRSCNRSKSDKTSPWIIRGYTGSVIHNLMQSASILILKTLKRFWIVYAVIIMLPLLILIFILLKI